MANITVYESGTGYWNADIITNATNGYVVNYAAAGVIGLNNGSTYDNQQYYWTGNFTQNASGITGGTLNALTYYDEGSYVLDITNLNLDYLSVAQYTQYSNDTARWSIVMGGNDYLYSVESSRLQFELYDGNDIAVTIYGENDIEGGAGNDQIYNYSSADNSDLYGDAGDDFLVDSIGDTYLNGGQGSDYISAGGGNDYISDNYSTGDNIVLGGGGADYISLGDGADYVFSDYGSAEIGQDTIYAGYGNDTIFSGEGADYMDLSSGNDVGSGGNGADTIFGGNGNDYIYGDFGATEVGADSLNGGDGTDLIIGGAGNDTMNGSYGVDYLMPGTGTDSMTGGTDRDFFWWTAANEFGDVISDFSTSQGDIIVIRPVLDAAGISATAGNAAAAGYLSAAQSGTSTILRFDADAGGAGAAVQIALLQNFNAANFSWNFNAY
ncbi:MAG: calcium-binding protein [Hyphomicrobiaceae bacterium]